MSNRTTFQSMQSPELFETGPSRATVQNSSSQWNFRELPRCLDNQLLAPYASHKGTTHSLQGLRDSTVSKRQCTHLGCSCKLQGKYKIISLLKLWVITPGLSVLITDKVHWLHVYSASLPSWEDRSHTEKKPWLAPLYSAPEARRVPAPAVLRSV